MRRAWLWFTESAKLVNYFQNGCEIWKTPVADTAMKVLPSGWYCSTCNWLAAGGGWISRKLENFGNSPELVCVNKTIIKPSHVDDLLASKLSNAPNAITLLKLIFFVLVLGNDLK